MLRFCGKKIALSSLPAKAVFGSVSARAILSNMQIIEGTLPEQGSDWSALLVLSPGESPGLAWRLGRDLAKAYDGRVIVAVFVDGYSTDQVELARDTLRWYEERNGAVAVTQLVVLSTDLRSGIIALVKKASIDLLLVAADAPRWPNLDRVPCTVAAIRGDRPGDEGETGDSAQIDLPVSRLLVPTSGGPNSVHALSLLLPLSASADITALYIATSYLGPNEEALGRARLRQTMTYIDAADSVESQLIQAPSITEGIVSAAGSSFDAIVIGASQESSLDRVLFGNIPAAVVRQSRKPVVVIRQAHSRVGNVMRDLSWAFQNVIPRMVRADRSAAYVRIRRGARPDRDFFVLIGLATAIASLGMLLDSPAVVIGAMLVAPLMSPIVGTGLATVLGDTRFLRLSLGAVARGVLLAILVGLLAGLITIGQPLTAEVLARTQPNLLDLGVALFSGMAGAYALCRSDAAGALPGVAIAAALVPPLASIGISLANGSPTQALGAVLLFSTNLVAISSAAALVFLLLGFRPEPEQKERKSIRAQTARVAVILLVTVSALLAVATYNLTRDSRLRSHIREAATLAVSDLGFAELADVTIGNVRETPLHLTMTIMSERALDESEAIVLQQELADEIDREVALLLNVIPSQRLEPLRPSADATQP